MQIRLLGDLRAQRVDDHQFAARALCFANAPDKMKIGDRRVVAPDDIELGVLGELRRASGHGAIGPRPRLAAHAAAQGPPIELGSAQPVEETRGHAVAGEEAVRAGIVQRHYRLRPPPADDVAHSRMDLVQRRIPRDALELLGTLRPDAAQGMEKAALSVDEVTHVPSDLVANHRRCVGQRVGAANPDDTALLDADSEATGVRTVEGADARAFLDGHGVLLAASRWGGSDCELFGLLRAAASVLEPAFWEPNPPPVGSQWRRLSGSNVGPTRDDDKSEYHGGPLTPTKPRAAKSPHRSGSLRWDPQIETASPFAGNELGQIAELAMAITVRPHLRAHGGLRLLLSFGW